MQVLSFSARGVQLVLPVNMVAQIMGRSVLADAPGAQLPAIAGTISWREFSVPVCRSSQLLGFDERADDGFERIVVLWPMKSAHSRAFIGLTSLTAPRVVNIESGEAPASVPDLAFALDFLTVEGATGVIPDIERLSGLIYPPDTASS